MSGYLALLGSSFEFFCLVILDLERFALAGQPHWDELEATLQRLENDPDRGFHDLAAAQRFHYLYQRAASDLGRLASFSAETSLRRRLEGLVARAYAELHSAREARDTRWRPLVWLLETFPRTFRRHAGAWWLAVAVTLLGSVVGAFLVAADPEAKASLLPFGHGEMNPSERVAKEEAGRSKGLANRRSSFAAELMANNIRVSLKAVAFGLTWGIGTLAILFYNGVILGGVMLDYLRAGEGLFLAGWILPHGSTEIPAIVLGGQAGLMLARGVIGWGARVPLGRRLRAIAPDVATIIGGLALLLVWAGIVESFLSQYHEPVLPYWLKITFGVANLAILGAWLFLCGRGPTPED